ncbi:type II toxin-antitoxin system RelE/ParE family toxin [Sphingomonas xinjiangensis]|uniref:Toxin ParE1/3/4 n=1 Tax=Sphingomonas xinjiangensis TaxID=643568 RepID=A0A840YQJ4_9SPHN|nr:toxin ParE1/3/4 [Sphingomonas xinjiangensis]
MLDIRWALLAQADLKRIASYYQRVDPSIAVDLAERIVRAARLLSELPRAGQATQSAGRRRWRVPGTQYLIFYPIAAGHVPILRVLHGAQLLAGRL